MRRITSWVAGVGMVLSLAGCGQKPAVVVAGPPVVLVTEATKADVPIFSETIATLDGSTNTQIHSQVGGFLIKQAYIEGSVVKAGDLLFQIDPKPFQADLDKALATLANKQAVQLASKQTLDRYKLLVKSGAISQQEYQNQVQNELAAQADVDAAQASVDTAKINLGYTKITSPIVGVAGRAIPGVGDLISTSMTLTTVSTVNPIQADFTLPEQFYLNNAERLAKISAVPLADRPANIELILADGTPYSAKGQFYYVNRQIQTATGAITAYALFPNPDRILRPGQYAKVRAITRQVDGAVLIPQIALSELQGIEQVWVIKDDNTAELRTVTLGDRAGSLQIVTSGIKAGEKIVAEGIQKCRDGQKVDPQPYISPHEDAPTNLPAATPPVLPANP